MAETYEPQSIEVYFDGLRLARRRPQIDPATHIRSRSDTSHARSGLDFTEVLFSEAEAVFGGVYGNEISTEISAVPIRFDKGEKA